MLNLKDKIAVVSGCGSIGSGFGNGRAISTLLARQGAKVFGTDINEEAGQNTSNFIKEEGNDFMFHKVNMTNEKEVKEFFKKIEKNSSEIAVFSLWGAPLLSISWKTAIFELFFFSIFL